MAVDQAEKLLSKGSYDNDATMMASDDDLNSGDESIGHHVGEDDRAVLDEAEEQENLLHQPSRFDAMRRKFAPGPGKEVAKGTRRQRRQRRKDSRKRRKTNEDGELMFEMEEGFKDTSSQEHSESESAPVEATWAGRKPAKRRCFCCRIFGLVALILLLFLGLLVGAYRASPKPPQLHQPATLSNGTHRFAPTTILISLDGFRADFLNRDITPALNAFIASGVSPRYMLPSFPSVTFPNHFTLVTGLYPESHGIVGNQFWDPEFQEEFYYTDTQVSMHPKWWTAEPLWVTAENQGVRTAIHMWPGSEAHIPDVEPTYLDKFNESEVLTNKVDRILTWLDLPGDDDAGDGLKRPQLIAAYVPDVDSDGHKYGPNSTEIRATIADADSMLTLLVEGLLTRNLSDIVNIIVVSDHGMATTSIARTIQLDDLIDLSLVDHIDGWPLRGLRLKNPDRDVPILYEQLKEASKMGGFDVYTRATMPKRYHFTNNDRIAPLWVVPKTGWAVVEKNYFDVAEALKTGTPVRPLGLHGYDHEHPLMRAIFVARGPAFPHTPNSRVPVFQNTEVYNIVCDSLGIIPHPNNGTLRLPLKTVGLHSDPIAEPLATPSDPVAVPDEDSDGDDSGNRTSTGWWDYIHNQLEKAKEWAKQIVDSVKDNEATHGG